MQYPIVLEKSAIPVDALPFDTSTRSLKQPEHTAVMIVDVVTIESSRGDVPQFMMTKSKI